MSVSRLSLHSVVALCLMAMGVVGFGLVLFSASIHRDVSHENRITALNELIRHQSRYLAEQQLAAHRIFALDLARDPAFRAAWDRGPVAPALSERLEAALAGAAERGLPLHGARVFDAALRPIARAGEAEGCPGLSDVPPAGVVSRTCVRDDDAARSVMVSLPGFDPAGYIEVIGDPVDALKRIGREAGMALRIERPGGQVLFESDNWSALAGHTDSLSTRYLTAARPDEPVFAIRAATDVSLLNQQLGDTRDFVLLAAGVIVALTMLATLIGLRRLMLPLRALQRAAEHLSRDGGATTTPFTPVSDRAPPEIATPIRSFNEMVRRVRALVQELEGEVGQRREAEIAANRARELAEAHARNASQAREFSHSTLEAVVDAVVATDVQGRIEYMNPVAEKLTGCPEAKAVGRPIDDVVVLHDRAGRRRADMVEQCLHGVYSAERRVLRLCADGRERDIDCAVVPMRDSGATLVGAVMVFHDVTEAQRMTERLTYQATHDSLTALINRYEFESRLRRVAEAARDGGPPGALCYLDLDQFKLVNDTCGHVAGDELLRQLAVMMGDRLAGRGTLGRLGGDEFGLLLSPCTVPQARAIADDLREAIQQFRFVWSQRIFSIGVSIGVVAIEQRSGNTDILLSAADTACYMAKETGRNRVQVYQEDDEALVARHAEMHWVSEINRALESDRFALYCQDIVAAADDGRAPAQHFEILLRMVDDDGRVWPPGSFLSAAERYNLAPAIDRWVVRHALAWMAANELPAEAMYSINLSGRSLADDGFLDDVLRELDGRSVRPQNLCFEVTETAAISNLAGARVFMEALRARGCRFSLDDFGSGLSSFNYLQNLPVDFLKIDGAFVRDIHDNPVHQSIVRSMNDVGHAMHMHTIAEFVENQEVIDCLRGIGVDYLQGFVYARPRPLGQCVPSLADA